MQRNVAFLAKNFKIFWGGGVPSLGAFIVSMFLPKTNPFITILDPPLIPCSLMFYLSNTRAT